MVALSSYTDAHVLYRSKLHTSNSTKEEMACITSAFEEPCMVALEYSLSNFLFDQACFFAESLAVECPGDDSLHVLATTLVRCGQYERAATTLQKKRTNDPRLRYLLGLCCFKMEKYEEAERALVGQAGIGKCVSGGDMLNDVAGGGAGLFLLGQVKEKLQCCVEQAVECYAKCLELCPFMWCAYEKLSWLILSVSSSASLGSAATFARSSQSGGPGAFAGAYFNDDKFDSEPLLQPMSASNGRVGINHTQGDGANTAIVRKRRRNDIASPAKYHGDLGSTICTPIQTTSALNGRTPVVNRSAIVASQSPDVMCSPSLSSLAAPRSVFQSPADFLSKLSPRRLLSYPCSPSSPSNKRCSSSLLGTAVNGMDADQIYGMESGQRSSTPAIEIDTSYRGYWTLSSFLKILGESLHALHTFDCPKAYDTIQRLPSKHQNSVFIQNLVARCHFEACDYRKAVAVYAKCCEEHHFNASLDLEYYSTALWQLGASLDLGCLARRALAWDRSQGKAWCVVGNCFSLQRDHEQAIRCFRRAIQLDTSLTYAYTLIGHEYVELEKLDKATEMYEQALSTDVRHYNAWWGLGNLYLRQEEFQKAKYHFQKAVEINGKNAVLRISLGQACIDVGETQKALELFDVASQSAAGNAQACFHKGCVLVSMGRHAEAVEELHRAQNSAPRNANIKYQLGLAYAGLRDCHRATMNFSSALELCGKKDSKDHQAILCAQVAMQEGRSRSGSV